jgi:hypothetical protein
MSGKTDAPPPLPQDVLRRVCRLARFEGGSLLGLAGFFAVLAAVGRDFPGAIAGCLAAGAGALELRAVSRIESGDERGVSGLVHSQMALLAVILAYCLARLWMFDPAALEAMLTLDRRQELAALGLTDEQFRPVLEQGYRALYLTVAVVSLAYQGGMALYYHRKGDELRLAMASES